MYKNNNKNKMKNRLIPFEIVVFVVVLIIVIVVSLCIFPCFYSVDFAFALTLFWMRIPSVGSHFYSFCYINNKQA